MKICLNTLTRGPLQQNYPHITLKIKLQHKWVKLPLLHTICSKKKIVSCAVYDALFVCSFATATSSHHY